MARRNTLITRHDVVEIITAVTGTMLFLALLMVLIIGPGFFLPDLDDLLRL